MPGAAGVSPIRFHNPEEQRKGAQTVLRSLDKIPAIQTALAEIKRGAPLEQVSVRLHASLEIWLQEQQETAQRLENDLRHERTVLGSYKQLFQELKDNPLQKQLQAEIEAHGISTQRLQEAESALSRNEQTLARERREHAAELRQLQAEIAELNRLVAKQHLKLQELTGLEPE
jgi:DNA repair exonuclease SbcCD ATPase subunit